MFRTRLFVILFTCGLLLSNIHQAIGAGYQLSMLPRYSTEEIYKRITPLVDYLKTKTGLNISPTMTTTFDQYTKALIRGKVAIGFENPYIYVLASRSHEAVAMAVKGKNGDKFRGIIITAAGSPLHSLMDLKGKKIAIVSTTSAGGYLSQKLSLLEKGIDVTKDCQIEEAPENKQENVVFSVFTGDVDAGFIRESALHKADQFVPAGSIRVLAYT
ncbi:MAG TPA: phosphate/phosphite/phosphonate ABC transporter substrate-binding protein, partial [Desulfobulbus sp.]|nr:phosphate/phosphite/phosphonate ABC transporter substrate-binding protein [Desulfobulbus sp.]